MLRKLKMSRSGRCACLCALYRYKLEELEDCIRVQLVSRITTKDSDLALFDFASTCVDFVHCESAKFHANYC